MNLHTKIVIALGVLFLLAGMAYFYATNGQLQGRFNTPPTLPVTENLPR